MRLNSHQTAAQPVALVPLRTPETLPSSDCMQCKSRKSCLAGSLAGDALGEFAQLITARRRVVRHEQLVRVDEAATKLFAVHFGQFKAIAVDQRGHPHVAGFLMPGDLIGLDAFAGGRHRLGAIALEDSGVCEIPIEGLTRALSLDPALLDAFLRKMSTDVLRAIEGGHLLANLRADRRFARFLYQLAERHRAMGYSQHVFYLRMSRVDIGSYLGISVENLSRMISKFRRRGLFNMDLRKVEIFDLEAVAEYSNRNDVGGE